MSDSDPKLEALFQAAVEGQKRLEQQPTDEEGDASEAASASDPAEEELLIEELDAASIEAPPADEAPESDEATTSESARSAGEAVTEALLAAKKELASVLEQTQREAKSLHDRLLRVSADFENFKKRSRKQQEEAIRFANEGLLRELLPVLDSFDRALEHVTEDEASPIIQGIQMVHRHLVTTLEKTGLEKVSALDQAFDPTFHEAVEQVQTEEHPAGKVIREYQPGYLLQNRLLRPATVVVAMPPPEASTASEESGGEAEETPAHPESSSTGEAPDTGAVASEGQETSEEE